MFKYRLYIAVSQWLKGLCIGMNELQTAPLRYRRPPSFFIRPHACSSVVLCTLHNGQGFAVTRADTSANQSESASVHVSSQQPQTEDLVAYH